MIPQRKNRKEEILQAASLYFAQHGYYGATLSGIAELVGLTEPGLLHYFPSKVKLLQAVLDYRDRIDREKYRILMIQDGAPLLDALKALVAANQKRPGLVQLFTVMVAESITIDHPSHNFFVHRYRQIKGDLVEYLKGYFQEAGLREDVDFAQLAAVIFAVMDGLQVQWLLDPENVDMTTAIELFIAMVQAYLGISEKSELGSDPV
jgi:AcrR family transcriptional regulator